MTQVGDVDGAWLKFCGHYAGQSLHVQGKWQMWCVQERNYERAARAREAERQRRLTEPRDGPKDAADPYNSPEAQAAREKAQDRQWAERRRDAVPPPRDLMATVLGKLGANVAAKESA